MNGVGLPGLLSGQPRWLSAESEVQRWLERLLFLSFLLPPPLCAANYSLLRYHRRLTCRGVKGGALNSKIRDAKADEIFCGGRRNASQKRALTGPQSARDQPAPRARTFFGPGKKSSAWMIALGHTISFASAVYSYSTEYSVHRVQRPSLF
jgi:hypothetical protein